MKFFNFPNVFFEVIVEEAAEWEEDEANCREIKNGERIFQIA